MSYRNPTQLKNAVQETEGSSRSEKRRKGRKLFHFLNSSTDSQQPLITLQIKQSISQLFAQSLMQINGGGKKN